MTARPADDRPLVQFLYLVAGRFDPACLDGLDAVVDIATGTPGVLRNAALQRWAIDTAGVLAPIGTDAEVLDGLRAAQVDLDGFADRFPTDAPLSLVADLDRVRGHLAAVLGPVMAEPAEPDPPADGTWPDVDQVAAWRHDELMVFVRQHSLDVRRLLDDLRERATASGKVAPLGLRDVHGREDLAELLLGAASDQMRPGR